MVLFIITSLIVDYTLNSSACEYHLSPNFKQKLTLKGDGGQGGVVRPPSVYNHTLSALCLVCLNL